MSIRARLLITKVLWRLRGKSTIVSKLNTNSLLKDFKLVPIEERHIRTLTPIEVFYIAEELQNYFRGKPADGVEPYLPAAWKVYDLLGRVAE